MIVHGYIPVLPPLRWQDAMDVLVVAYLIYRVAILIRGTRTLQMITGMLILGVAFVGSQVFGLFTLNWLLNNFLGSIFIIIVVIFQADIRRALTRVGTQPFFTPRPAGSSTAESIATAAAWLAARKIGALVVIENEVGLSEYVETGRTVDAQLSPELIETIFFNGTPLHDGAMIVKGGRALAAGCVLPLSSTSSASLALGTRHRAAIGITEDSDAVAVVVSEESGAVSIARAGELNRGVGVDGLIDELKRFGV